VKFLKTIENPDSLTEPVVLLLQLSTHPNSTDVNPIANCLPLSEANWLAKHVNYSNNNALTSFCGVVLPRNSRQLSAVLSMLPKWREIGQLHGVLARTGSSDESSESESHSSEEASKGVFSVQQCSEMMLNSLQANNNFKHSSALDANRVNEAVFVERCKVDAERENVTNLSSSTNINTNTNIPVSLLLGITGSPLIDAAENVISIGSEDVNWFSHHESFVTGEFDAEVFANEIYDAFVDSGNSFDRIIVTLSGFLDARKVTIAIDSHPSLVLASSTNVVSSDSLTYWSSALSSNQWTPYLFDQCCGGFITHVLLYNNEKGDEDENHTKAFLARLKLMENPPKVLGTKLNTFNREIVEVSERASTTSATELN